MRTHLLQKKAVQPVIWRRKFLALLAAGVSFPCMAMPTALRVNSLGNPLGIDSLHPVLSWQSDDAAKNWKQGAYRIEVASSAELLAASRPDVWDSGRVSSAESVSVPYAGSALVGSKRYFWRVSTWDTAGKEQVSKDTAWFETGLLGEDAWQAKWISHLDSQEAAELSRVNWIWLQGRDARHVSGNQAAEFRYTLHLAELPDSAVLRCLTSGLLVAEVNGRQTGTKQDWGAFDREDIRGQLRFGAGKQGDNEILVRVKARGASGDQTVPDGFAAALDLRGADGQQRHLLTDSSWTARQDEHAVWQPAQVVGSLASLQANVGSDRQVMIPAPDRLATRVSLLRRSFAIHGGVRSARLYVTALGSYRAFLNGQRVGETELTPGFTDFRKRVHYQTYDVTSQLRSGENALAVKLAGGWHGSPLLWSGVREFEGPDTLRAQLVIRLNDNTVQQIITDRNWESANDATDSAEIYGGESYDARIAQPLWNTARFVPGAGWTRAVENSAPKNVVVVAQPDAPPHITQTLQPVAHRPLTVGVPAGTQLFDMGQNMVGVVHLRIRGKRGTIVRLRFAERIKPDGSIYTENLRNADATDEYTLRGGDWEEWSPVFTFHGFRYVQVEGATPDTELGPLKGEVINSLPDKPSMRFSSSSPLLDGMFQLGLWGQRGNFVSIPTDCPQRDERMGWMGDAGVFWRTGSYNFDIGAFSHKFMDDVVDGQDARGVFANISPNLLLVGSEATGAPGWGDAGVLIPYATWLQYGDRGIIEKNWDAMERWMQFIERSNPDGLRQKDLGPNYADWLAPDPNTPADLVATAYWALVAQQMRAMASATGRTEAAARYDDIYKKIRAAYRRAYVHAGGDVQGNTQTAYVVTLYAGLSQPEERSAITARLVADIEKHGNHLTTGFLGTPFLLFVLDAEGRSDVAFRLLLNDTYPSWGYMLSKGATTWWERWNGDTGDPSMNSYNHYAFGSVMAWVYRRVSGIDTDVSGPGFHHLVIAPHTDARLTHAHSEYDSVYGEVITDWTRSADGGLKLRVKLPANTSASVELPPGPHGEVLQDGVSIHIGKVEIGSGETEFLLY